MSDTATYDLSERDPEFIRQSLPVVRLYTDLWHRADVRGLKHLKGVEGALLVGNHSGGLVTPDAPVLALAIMKRYGIERPVFLLAHDALFWVPGTSALRKWGIMPASRANAIAAMRKGGAVIVFPGGDREVFRPTSEQGRVDLAGRHGFVDTALTARVPIVPFVSIGAQETQWFLSRGEWLGRHSPLRDSLRSTMWPISFGFPFGLSVGGLPPNVPLPSKITTQVLAPIHVREQFGGKPDRDEVYEHVRRVMQEALDRLVSGRRFPVIG